jgi:hypothetical protein
MANELKRGQDTTILWPRNRAEQTVLWFLYGRKFPIGLPYHFNCRCATNTF